MKQSANKPIPVWIVAGFAWFAASISLLVGIVLLFPGSGLDRIWQWNQPAHAAFQSMGKWVGAAFLVLVIPAAIIAVGFSRGRRWAWWAAVLMFVVNGLGDVGSLRACGLRRRGGWDFSGGSVQSSGEGLFRRMQRQLKPRRLQRLLLLSP